MLLSEVQFDLLETIRNAKITDDENISLELLTHWINNQRALWIKRNLDNGNFYDENLIQTISIGVDIIDPTVLYQSTIAYNDTITLPGYTSKSRILRTTNSIPAILEMNYGLAVYEVGGIDFTQHPFSFTPFSQMRVAGNGKFNSKHLFVAQRDNYWYIKYGKDSVYKNMIDKIVIRAIFQNPTEVPDYDYDTSTYPISRDLLVYMKDYIIKNDLRAIIATNSDQTNNSNGNVAQVQNNA